MITLAGNNENPQLELARAWEPLGSSKLLQNREGSSSFYLFPHGN